MHLVLAILQGVGLAAAAGIRPFLPAMLAGALASANLGVNFGGTDYAFLEAPGFLLAVVVVLALVTVFLRGRDEIAAGVGPVGAAVAGLGIGTGALLFAGSLADINEPAWPGLIGGVLCALLAGAAARQVLAGAAKRLDAAARAALPLYADGASLVLAGLSVLAPPLGALGLIALAVLLVRGRRRDGAKYAGLRILNK